MCDGIRVEVEDDILNPRPAEGVFERDSIFGDDILDRGVFKDDCLDKRPAEGVFGEEDPRDDRLDRGVVRDGFSKGGDMSKLGTRRAGWLGCSVSEFMVI